jgi:hypothetical protein
VLYSLELTKQPAVDDDIFTVDRYQREMKLVPPLLSSQKIRLRAVDDAGNPVSRSKVEASVSLTCTVGGHPTVRWECSATGCVTETEISAPQAKPVGGEFLDNDYRQALLPAVLLAGPPTLFMLNRVELMSDRRQREFKKLAFWLVQEIAAVIDKGCSVAACGPTPRLARAAAQQIIDDEEEGLQIESPPSTRHPRDPDSTDERQLVVRFRQRKYGIELRCVSETDFYGWNTWHSVTSCTASLYQGRQLLVRYVPEIELSRPVKKTPSPPVAMNQYRQTLNFPDKGCLTILTGRGLAGLPQPPNEESPAIGSIVRSGSLTIPQN